MTCTDYTALFKDSIQRGTGKAYLLAVEHPECDFTDEIIAACVKNFAYDGQSEGSRAGYLLAIFKLNGENERVKSATLKAIQEEVSDTWTLTQLFDLALLFAKDGDRRFKEAIYARFFRNTISGSDWVGYSEIIELDGLAGLRHIAKVMGQGLIDNPNDWQDDMIVRHFAEKYPGVNVRSELKNWAKSSPAIERYLSAIEEVETARVNRIPVSETYSSLLDEIKNRRILYPLKKRTFTECELMMVADALVNESNPKYVEKFLYFFGYFKFPLNEKHLLKYAKRKKNGRNSIVERAIDALKFISSDAVRDFAIRGLKYSRAPEDYADLLILNYRAGDNVLLSRIASRAKTDDVVEQLAKSYSQIYNENQTPESFEPLFILYNKMTCGVCRELVVSAMLKNGGLSAGLLEELRHDSNEAIQELVQHGI